MRYPPLAQLNGVFGVMKPPGITAAKTCNQIRHDLVKELEFIRPEQLKIGHGGTLDRQATGVLPVGLGTGCVLLKELLHSDKKYICQAELGVETDTGNADGNVTQKLPYGLLYMVSNTPGNPGNILEFCKVSWKLSGIVRLFVINVTNNSMTLGKQDQNDLSEHIMHRALEHALKSFVGQIKQVPPTEVPVLLLGVCADSFSALKYKGRRLSDFAYAGEPIPEIKLLARTVTAHRVVCTSFNLPHVTLEIDCGGGFYIRSLVRDLGTALGSCAHVTGLERTTHGDITTDMCIPAFKWTVDAVLEAIERYKELHDAESDRDCNELQDHESDRDCSR